MERKKARCLLVSNKIILFHKFSFQHQNVKMLKIQF